MKCLLAFLTMLLLTGSHQSAAQQPAMVPVVTSNPVSNGCCASVPTSGVGTEMTRIINRMGLGSDCGRCKALAAQMDQNGVQWVKQNRQYIVQQTVSNAENLGHRMGPVRRLGVRVILNKSIRRSR